MEAINKNLFAQVPFHIIQNPNITNLQFRIYCILEIHRFLNSNTQKQNPITSLEIAQSINKHHDTIRRELNKMNDSFEGFISLYFHKKYFGKPDEIIVHWNYLNNEVKVINQDINNLDYQERTKLNFFLNNSRYFSEYKGNNLMDIVNCENVSELMKGILYTDSKPKIKNPVSYLKSCFKNGFYKYDKCFVNVEDLKATGKLPNNITIHSEIIYALDYKNFKELEKNKSEDYKFYLIRTAYEILIYKCTYKNKTANIKNALDKLEINYKIYLRKN